MLCDALCIGTTYSIIIWSCYNDFFAQLLKRTEINLLQLTLEFKARCTSCSTSLSHTNFSGLLAAEGPVQQKNRRFILRVFRDLGIGKSQATQVIQEECRELVSHLRVCERLCIYLVTFSSPALVEKPRWLTLLFFWMLLLQLWLIFVVYGCDSGLQWKTSEHKGPLGQGGVQRDVSVCHRTQVQLGLRRDEPAV